MMWKDPSKELPDYDVPVLTWCFDGEECFASIKHRSKRKGISKDKYGFAVYVPKRVVLGWMTIPEFNIQNMSSNLLNHNQVFKKSNKKFEI